MSAINSAPAWSAMGAKALPVDGRAYADAPVTIKRRPVLHGKRSAARNHLLVLAEAIGDDLVELAE